jgi:hypothetical protein
LQALEPIIRAGSRKQGQPQQVRTHLGRL